MKAVTGSENKHHSDFYGSTLAPVHHRHNVRFRAADAVLLIVLFLEIAVLTRLLIAN